MSIEEKTHLTATVGFARKTQPAQYEAAEASIFLQTDIDLGLDDEQIVKRLEHAFLQAKSVVLNQLGVPFEMGESGIITEIAARAFPGTVDEGGQAGPPARLQPQQQQAPQAAAGGVPSKCVKCDGTEFYDNRESKASGKYSAKSPDFKCRGCGAGIWPK